MDQQTLIALMRQDLQDWRAKERARAEERAQRRTFEGTSKGRGLSTSPTGRPSKAAVPAVSLQRGGPAGEIIHTSATSDPVASGGDYLVADTEVDRYGFDSTTLGDTYTIPRTATYKVELDFEWDDYHGGGTVAVEVNGTVVRTLSSPDGNGQACTWSPTFRASKGDTVKVKVTQTSGSAQAATFTVTVAVVEPVRAIADPGWTKVASVDAWGIFNDGTSWWTTEGNSGLTVSQYDTSWTLVSSFEASTFGENGVTRVRGITSDGTDLWLTGPYDFTTNTCRVARYSKAGVLQASFDIGKRSPSGLAFDGTDLWIEVHDGDGSNAELRRYATDGTLQETVALSDFRHGLDMHDGDLVIAHGEGGDAVEVRTTAGTLRKTIPTSSAIDGGPTGVWVEADGTLYASADGDGVYRWGGSL